MSVIAYERERILTLAVSVASFPEIRQCVLDHDSEQPSGIMLSYGLEKNDENLKKYAIERILFVFKRAFIANQLAYHYQYSDEETETVALHLWNNDELDDEKFELKDEPEWKNGIHDELRGLSYNLYTNNGNQFVDAKDRALIDSFVTLLEAYRIESGYDDSNTD